MAEMPLPKALQLSLPANHHYFDGHFIDHKILPAVAQISLCLDSFNQQYQSVAIRLYRARFFNLITPDVALEIQWKHKGNTLMSEIHSPQGLCSRLQFVPETAIKTANKSI